MSRLIGRILLGAGRHRPALSSHPSARAVTGALVRPTRRLRRAAVPAPCAAPSPAQATGSPSPSWSCSRWGLPSRAGHPARWWSLTPPFHPYPHHEACTSRPLAVCFLWHCPASHPGWALPTTLPCGVRTFLDTTDGVHHPDAVAARPAHPRLQPSACIGPEDQSARSGPRASPGRPPSTAPRRRHRAAACQTMTSPAPQRPDHATSPRPLPGPSH